MIREDKCFNCPSLFEVTASNTVRFCNSKEGDFIDNYADKKDLMLDFRKKVDSCPAVYPLARQKLAKTKYNYQEMFGYSLKRAIKKKIRERKPFLPERVFCFPSFACNNDCLHCFAGDKSKRKSLTLTQAKVMIKKHAFSYRKIHIGGGEPTLFRDLFGLVGFSKALDLNVQLYSNCRKMSDKNFAKDLVNSGIDGITVPIHSHIPKLHDFITQRKGSFKETLAGIDNLLQQGFKGLHVMIIIHKQNYQHLPELISFLVGKKIKQISIESLIFAGSAAKHTDLLAIKLSRMVKYIEQAFERLIKSKIYFFTTTLPLCLFRKDYWKYFLNLRYSLMVTNFPHGDGLDKRKRYKNIGTGLWKKCINCNVKIFCPGTLQPYYYFYGDAEFRPIENFEFSRELSFISPLTLKNILIGQN